MVRLCVVLVLDGMSPGGCGGPRADYILGVTTGTLLV